MARINIMIKIIFTLILYILILTKGYCSIGRSQNNVSLEYSLFSAEVEEVE